MGSKHSFNTKSYGELGGAVTGYLLGKAVQVAELGIDAMELLSRGNANAALNVMTKAIKTRVQTIERSVTKPFALDAHELSLKEEFKKGLTKGFTAARTAKPQKAPGRTGPKLAPS